MDAPIVYLAGPCFTRDEKEGMEAIAAILERSGLGVYLESRDGLDRVPGLFAGLPTGDPAPAAVSFSLAVYQLVSRCECLVLNMNGRVPDEGGTFSAAVAFALDKPVILYKRDHRTELYGCDNAMISGLSPDFSTVGSAELLPGEVRSALERGRRARGSRTSPPPAVMAAAEMGSEVWTLLAEHGAGAPSTDTTDLVSVLVDLYRSSVPRPPRPA